MSHIVSWPSHPERYLIRHKFHLVPFIAKVVTKHVQHQCGLHITPHDLRRTFAGVAEVAGIGGTMKKDLFNHLSGRDVTDDYTGQSDMDDLRDAMERIEAKMMVFAQRTDPAAVTQKASPCPSPVRAPKPQIAHTSPEVQPSRRILAPL